MLLSYRIGRFVLGLLCAGVVSGLQAKAQLELCFNLQPGHLKHNLSCALTCNPDTTPAQPHQTSSTQQTKNETTNVIT